MKNPSIFLRSVAVATLLATLGSMLLYAEASSLANPFTLYVIAPYLVALALTWRRTPWLFAALVSTMLVAGPVLYLLNGLASADALIFAAIPAMQLVGLPVAAVSAWIVGRFRT